MSIELNPIIDRAMPAYRDRPVEERARLRALNSEGQLGNAVRGCAAMGRCLTDAYRAMRTLSRRCFAEMITPQEIMDGWSDALLEAELDQAVACSQDSGQTPELRDSALAAAAAAAAMAMELAKRTSA